MLTTTTSGGSTGWTVMPEWIDATGDRMYKWSAHTALAGAWGYERDYDLALERAREEFSRLSGE